MTVGRGEFGATRIAWTDASLHDLSADDVLDDLGEQQVRRYAALTGLAAHRFLVSRWLAGQLVAELADHDDLRLVTTCPRCGADHGQPRFETAPVVVSISYAGSMVVVAAAHSTEASAVGVDIERQRSGDEHLPLVDLASLFAPSPSPTLQEWTLIEAALKADGRGLNVDLSLVEIEPIDTGRAADSRAIRIPGRSEPVVARQIDGPAKFVLSSAMVRAVAQTKHPS